MEKQNRPAPQIWFITCFMSGFFLPFAVLYISFRWWMPHNFEGFFPALAVSLLLATSIPLAVNRLSALSRIERRLSVGFSLALCAMINLSFGTLIYTSVQDSYAAAGTLSEFAQKDFDIVDDLGSGQISAKQVQKLIADQEKNKAALRDLDNIEGTIDKLPVSEASRTLGKSGLLLARTELTLPLVNSESFERLQVLNRFIAEAGRAQGDTFVVDRRELANFRSTLATRFPIWTWIVTRFSAS